MLGRRPTVAAEIARPLAARNGIAFGPQLPQLLVEALHLIDGLHHLFQARCNAVFGQLVVIKDHDFFDGFFAGLDLPRQGKKRLGHDGRARRALKPFIKEVVVFDDDELTEDRVAARLKEVVETIDEMERLYKKLGQLRIKRDGIPRSKRPRDFRRYSWAVAEHRILISQLLRSIQFTHTQRKALIGSIRLAMDEMRPLEREANRLEKRVEGVRTNGNKDLRKELRQAKVNLGDFELRMQATTIELRRSYQNIVMGEDQGKPPSASSSKPTSGWLCRSPRNTPIAASSSWT